MDFRRNWELASWISIDTNNNRYRAYTIYVARPNLFHNEYSLILRWGRINGRQKRQAFQFQSEKEMLKLLKSVVKKRIRNGYQLIQKSDDFPVELEMQNTVKSSPYPIQTALF